MGFLLGSFMSPCRFPDLHPFSPQIKRIMREVKSIEREEDVMRSASRNSHHCDSDCHIDASRRGYRLLWRRGRKVSMPTWTPNDSPYSTREWLGIPTWTDIKAKCRAIRARITIAIHDFLTSKGRIGLAILFLLFMEDDPRQGAVGNISNAQWSLMVVTSIIVPCVLAVWGWLNNVIPVITSLGNAALFAFVGLMIVWEPFHIYLDYLKYR